jgi:cell division septal protein FtsQ
MKLKKQGPPPKRPRRAPRAVRRLAASGARGRQARRPGAPMRRRFSGRLPSVRRLIAAVGAVAAAAVLVALLSGPWLRVTDVAWAGQHYTDADDLRDVLAPQRGTSVLAIDTAALRVEIERMPSVAEATVTASLTGELAATVEESPVAFVWETARVRFLGASDGTIFASGPVDAAPDPGLAALPHVSDDRLVARLVTVGDVIPEALLRTASDVAAIDPARLGSRATALSVRLDDEYGFRIVAAEPGWEVALGVFGLDPRESEAEAASRLERQVTAVRTLFASQAEAEIGWVDVRNPGKVYFRAKG